MSAEALTVEQAVIFAERRPDIAAGLVSVVASGVSVYLTSSSRTIPVQYLGELQQQNSPSLMKEGER